MLIDVAISGDRNVIRKGAEEIHVSTMSSNNRIAATMYSLGTLSQKYKYKYPA